MRTKFKTDQPTGSTVDAIKKFANRITNEPMQDFPANLGQMANQLGELVPSTGDLPDPSSIGNVAPALLAFTKMEYGREVEDFIKSSKAGGLVEKKFLEKNFNRFLELYPEKALDYMKWEGVIETKDLPHILGSKETPAVGEYWAPTLGKAKSDFIQRYFESVDKFKTPEAKAKAKQWFDDAEKSPGMFTNASSGSGGLFDAIATKVHELIHNLKFKTHKGALGIEGRKLEEKEVAKMEQELIRGRHSELFEKSIADYENLERAKIEYFARKLQQSR